MPRNRYDPTEELLRKIFLQSALDAAASRSRALPPAAAPQEEEAFADPLLAAVAAQDIAAVTAALKAGADPNMQEGRPLRIAAERKNAALMQELVIRGADFAPAQKALGEEQKKITGAGAHRTPALDADMAELLRKLRLDNNDPIVKVLTAQQRMTPDEQARYNAVTGALNTLDSFKTAFMAEIAPLETLRMQRRILDGIETMKEEMAGRTLDKPKLPPPAHLGGDKGKPAP